MTKADLVIHAVWTTWRRMRVVDVSVEGAVLDAIRRKCLELRCPAVAIGADDDHVHILVRLHSQVPVARLVGEAKGLSSYLMSRTIAPGRPFRWHHGYYASSIHEVDVPSVARYVSHQREHHRERRLIAALEPSLD